MNPAVILPTGETRQVLLLCRLTCSLGGSLLMVNHVHTSPVRPTQQPVKKENGFSLRLCLPINPALGRRLARHLVLTQFHHYFLFIKFKGRLNFPHSHMPSSDLVWSWCWSKAFSVSLEE